MEFPKNENGHDIMYAVTKGEYSDFRVLALFTSDAKANKYIAEHFGTPKMAETHDVEIQEYLVDPDCPYENGLYPYSVSCDLKGARDDVKIDRMELTDPDARDRFDRREGRVERWTDQLSVDLWAQDKEHAAKIWQEKFRAIVSGAAFVYDHGGRAYICTGIKTQTRDQRNRVLPKPISHYEFVEAMEVARKAQDASSSS